MAAWAARLSASSSTRSCLSSPSASSIISNSFSTSRCCCFRRSMAFMAALLRFGLGSPIDGRLDHLVDRALLVQAAPAELAELLLERLDLVVGRLLDVGEGVARLLLGADQLVELEVKRVGVAVLGGLDHEDHQEGDDRRDRVDDEEPGVRPAHER